jgi:hypothetical protein
MDKVDYLEEANRQLTDETFYKKLDSDPAEEFSTKITQELKIMKENSHIDKNTFDYLTIPSLCGMLVYNDVTSIETRMVPEGRGFIDSIF